MDVVDSGNGGRIAVVVIVVAVVVVLRFRQVTASALSVAKVALAAARTCWARVTAGFLRT